MKSCCHGRHSPRLHTCPLSDTDGLSAPAKTCFIINIILVSAVFGEKYKTSQFVREIYL